MVKVSAMCNLIVCFSMVSLLAKRTEQPGHGFRKFPLLYHESLQNAMPEPGEITDLLTALRQGRLVRPTGSCPWSTTN